MLCWRRGEAEPKVFFAGLSGSRDLAGSSGTEVLGTWINLISRRDGRRVPERDPSRNEEVTDSSLRNAPKAVCSVYSCDPGTQTLLRKEDLEIQASLGYIVFSRSAWIRLSTVLSIGKI